MGEIRKYRSRDYHLNVVNCLNSYKSLIKNKPDTSSCLPTTDVKLFKMTLAK